MTQNARVARWIPTAVPPDGAGDGIETTGVPTSASSLPTKFSAAGGGGAAYASDAEVVTGTEPAKSVSPLTLRNEMAREFGIPTTQFANPIAINVRTGNPSVDGDCLIKTGSIGYLDASFLPAVVDGGVF